MELFTIKKLISKTPKFHIFILLTLLFVMAGIVKARAAAITISANTNWSAITTGSGVGGQPTTADAITINSGFTLTVNIASATCASITFAAVNATSTLTINSTNQLVLTGALTMPRPATGALCNVNVNAGTLQCATISMAATSATRADVIAITTGTLTVTGNITCSGNTGGAQINCTGTGIINFGGAFTTSNPTLSPGSAGTVNYTGTGAQTVLASNYFNLGFSGSHATTRITINGAIGIAGNLSSSASFSSGNFLLTGSTFTFNGIGDQSISALNGVTFPAITINKASGIALLTSSVTATTFNITAGTFDPSTYLLTSTTPTLTAGTLRVGASTWADNYSFSSPAIPRGFTIEYDNGDQIVADLSYSNLTLSGSGAKTFSSALTISNILNIVSPSTATLGGFSSTSDYIHYGGVTQLNASLTYGGTGSGAGNISANFNPGTGIVTILDNLTWVGGAIGNTTDWNTAANWDGGIIPDLYTNVIIPALVNQPSIGAAGADCHNIDIATGATLTVSASSTLNIYGTVTLTGTGNIIANATSTVNYADASQTIAAVNYGNLTLSGSGIDVLKTGTTTIAGNFTLSGTVSTTMVVGLAISGDLILGSGTSLTTSTFLLTLRGNYTNNGGTLTSGSGGITITGANTQDIAGFTTTGPVSCTKSGNTATISGNVTATTLTVNETSTGALLLSGTNNFSGTKTLTAGTLYINSAGALSGTGAISITTGTIDNSSGSAVTLTANNTITIGGNFTFGGSNDLNFGTGNITNSGSRTITLNGTSKTLKFGGTMTNGVNGVQTTTVNGVGNTLVLGAYALSNNGTSRIDIISGTGNVTILGAVTNGGSATTSGLTYSGSGVLTLSGVNTYAGATTLSSGTLNINSTTAIGAAGSTFILNGGTIDNTTAGSITLANNNPITIGGNFTFAGTQNLNLGTGAVTNSNSRSITLNGILKTLTLGGIMTNGFAGVQTTTVNGVGNTLVLGAYALSNNGTSRIDVISGTGNVTILGAVTNGGTASASGLTYNGSGVLTLSGVNTYAGATTLSSGTLNINSTTALGAAGSTFNLIGGTIDNTSTGSITLANNNPINIGGDFTYTGGSQNLNLGTGTVTMSADRQITISGQTLTMGGTLSAASNSITKTGSGTLSFGGNNVTLNNLTISAGTLTSTSGNLSLAGDFSNSGTFTHNNGTVTFSGSSSQTIDGSSISHFKVFTITNLAGVVSGNDLFIDGNLTLATNPNGTTGSLNMGSNTLTQGPSSATLGTGDVTGIVTRTSISASTRYTFGNQFTSIEYTSGTPPTDVSFKITIGAAPSWKSNTINRNYDVIQSGGSGAKATLQLHYLTSELNANVEANLVIWDGHTTPVHFEEHGRSSNSMVDDYVSLSNLGAGYFASTWDEHYWSMSKSETYHNTWTGFYSSDWTDGLNWSKGTSPSSTDSVDISDSYSSTYDPTLPTSTTIKTLTLLSGATLNGGTGTTLTISGGNGAWINNGATFNPESSTIVFSGGSPTISGINNLNNLTINSGTNLIVQSDAIIRIAGAVTNSGTWTVNGTSNTIEYNGSAQTVIIPNGTTPGYFNLIITNSGTKTMAEACTISGTLTINSGATLDDAGYALSLAGNIAGSGTHSGSSDITMTSSGQTIADVTIHNLILNNAGGFTLSGSPTITGLITLTSGELTVGNHTLTLAGSAPSKVDGVINASNSDAEVAFTNTGTMELPSGLFTGNIGNLTMNGTGGVTFNNPITISGNLNFINGILTLASDTITILDGGGTSGADTISYVDGIVKKIGNDAFIFPIGNSLTDDGGGYHAIGISAPGAATDAFAAKYIRSSANDMGPHQHPVTTVSDCEYWDLHRTHGTATVDVTLYGNVRSGCGTNSGSDYFTGAGYSLSSLRVVHWNGVEWEDANASGITSPVGNTPNITLTAHAISSFSPFAFGGIGNPLPVKLVSFTAQAVSEGVLLSWTTASENNNDHFDIERSSDGKSFNKIGEVAGNGNSYNLLKYTYRDNFSDAINPILYYRLKQVDYSNEFEYSGIRAVNFTLKDQVRILNNIPNPFSNDLTINYNVPKAGELTLKITDLTGRLVHSETISATKGYNSIKIRTPDFASGIYLVNIIHDGIASTPQKIVKE